MSNGDDAQEQEIKNLRAALKTVEIARASETDLENTILAATRGRQEVKKDSVSEPCYAITDSAWENALFTPAFRGTGLINAFADAGLTDHGILNRLGIGADDLFYENYHGEFATYIPESQLLKAAGVRDLSDLNIIDGPPTALTPQGHDGVGETKQVGS